MSRLTFESDGYFAVSRDNCFDDQNEDYCGPAIDRLAAYEDTGEPDELVKPVRCGECRYRNKQLCRAAARTKYNLKTEKWVYKTMMEDDGFCHVGEPREGSATCEL